MCRYCFPQSDESRVCGRPRTCSHESRKWRKERPTGKDPSHSTCACHVLSWRDWCLGTALFFTTSIHRKNGRQRVVFCLDDSRSGCWVYRRQDCKQSRRGRHPRHPVRCCRRVSRWLAVLHVWSCRRKRPQPLRSFRSGSRLCGLALAITSSAGAEAGRASRGCCSRCRIFVRGSLSTGSDASSRASPFGLKDAYSHSDVGSAGAEDSLRTQSR